MQNEQHDQHNNGFVNKMRLLFVVTTLSFAISSFVLAAQGRQDRKLRSERNDVWHAVICSIEQSVISTPDLTTKKKAQALVFYDRLLIDQVHTRGCGLVKPPPEGVTP